jgi:hypothetical protein
MNIQGSPLTYFSVATHRLLLLLPSLRIPFHFSQHFPTQLPRLLPPPLLFLPQYPSHRMSLLFPLLPPLLNSSDNNNYESNKKPSHICTNNNTNYGNNKTPLNNYTNTNNNNYTITNNNFSYNKNNTSNTLNELSRQKSPEFQPLEDQHCDKSVEKS